MPEATSPASPPDTSIAFPSLAITLFAFFVSASVPSPLFVVVRERWGFSPGMLTLAFSIYSLVMAARIVRGPSMGVVNGALSAAVIEAAPPARKALGSQFGAIVVAF